MLSNWVFAFWAVAWVRLNQIYEFCSISYSDTVLPSIYRINNPFRAARHFVILLQHRAVHVPSDDIQTTAGHHIHPRSCAAIPDSSTHAHVLGLVLVSDSVKHPREGDRPCIRHSIAEGHYWAEGDTKAYDQHKWEGFGIFFVLNILGTVFIALRKDIIWTVGAMWISMSIWRAPPKAAPVSVSQGPGTQFKCLQLELMKLRR